MRHFDFLTPDDSARLFHRPPIEFSTDDEPNLLGVALGATLYSPATRPELARDLARRTAQGVMSAVVCLEDAVADADLADAEQNAVRQLRRLAESGEPRPLVFVRVRAPHQIALIVDGLGEHADVLSGFVLPKFIGARGSAFLDANDEAAKSIGRRLFVMPVLESPEIIFTETRTRALLEIRELLEGYRDKVLAVRLGATDLSSAYGLRRPRDLTVYDIRTVADVIADVINVFGRADGAGFIVTGATWEYFTGSERLFKPQLRESPFAGHSSDRALRTHLIAKDLDALIREVVLDKANGIVGKTVIHPSHVAAVHALSVVTHEEYCDAADILETNAGGGVAASLYRNKMNESKPHSAWARRIMLRAQVFGVAGADVSFVDLLGAGLQQ
jgi:citrate lyase beta subunit